MKRGTIPILKVTILLSGLFVPVLLAHAGEPGMDSFGMNTTRVQQMGMGDLDMVMYDEPQEVNVHTLGGNIAGLIWDDVGSSLEGDFSYGSGSYTSEYDEENSWSYMGDVFSVYQDFPILGSLYSVGMGGSGLPTPGLTLSLKKQTTAFFLSGAYAHYVNKWESPYGYVSESSYSSPQFDFGVSAITTPEVSFGLALDYSSLKYKYSYSNGGTTSNDTSYSKFGGQIGLCRRRPSSGRFQTTSGGEFQYVYTDALGRDISFWNIGVEHVGGFSVGYGTVRVAVGRMTLDGDGMTDFEVGGRLFFQVPTSPLLFSMGLRRISLSEKNASPTQTTFSGGVGISVPAVYGGIEYVNDSFSESGITKIETLKLGSELRSTRPLVLRVGLKKMSANDWYMDFDESTITAGVGLHTANNLLVDLAYNNSRETYPLTYYEEEHVTDHIFALSLKKGF